MNEHLIEYFKPRFHCRINNEPVQIGEAEWFLERHPEHRYDPFIDFDVYLPKYGRNLQRPFVWSIKQKSELIKSILRDIKIDPLTIVQVRDSQAENPLVWQIIDGKQRLSTIFSYLRDEFAMEVDGVEYYYKDLPEELQKKIKWFDLRAYLIYHNIYHDPRIDQKIIDRETVTDEDRIELYLYINYMGTQQDESYMENLAELVNQHKNK